MEKEDRLKEKSYEKVRGKFSPDENDEVGSAYLWDRDGHLADATGEFCKATGGIWPRERLEYEVDCDPET